MSVTAPKGDSSLGACDERACQRPFGHRGACVFRLCDKPGCTNRARNAEERRCLRHEDRATYEKYLPHHPG